MRACFSSVLTDSTFTGRSQRSKEALEQVKHLLYKISEESNLDSYDEFSLRLLQTLERVYFTALSTTRRLREQLYGDSFMPFDSQNSVISGSSF